jgi:hypothetical protein
MYDIPLLPDGPEARQQLADAIAPEIALEINAQICNLDLPDYLKFMGPIEKSGLIQIPTFPTLLDQFQFNQEITDINLLYAPETGPSKREPFLVLRVTRLNGNAGVIRVDKTGIHVHQSFLPVTREELLAIEQEVTNIMS